MNFDQTVLVYVTHYSGRNFIAYTWMNPRPTSDGRFLFYRTVRTQRDRRDRSDRPPDINLFASNQFLQLYPTLFPEIGGCVGPIG